MITSARENKNLSLDNFPKLKTSTNDLELVLQEKFPLTDITSKKSYENALKVLDYLIENPDNLKEKDFKNYLGALTVLIERYEASENDSLYEGMEFCDVTDDLLEIRGYKRNHLEPIFGDKGQISRYLNKKIPLTVVHLD